ncbi:hypothetical protein ACFWHR_07410 [Leucobacter sp. NPDC058333]|uniref:hypothetical protein n=1 Tax=Leucobacter sp. NPDC058333 TaxID=3346450 RepID=UPI0036545E5F
MFELSYDPAYDPIQHLEQMKVRLVRHTLNNLSAVWVPSRKLVILDRNVASEYERPVLAHECAHAESNDPGGHDTRTEHRANLASGLRLADPEEWSTLTAAHADFDRICLELGITRGQFLALYKHFSTKRTHRLERYGQTIYQDPKMGAGQWARKFEVA